MHSSSFKVGDRVKVLDSSLTGEIVDINHLLISVKGDSHGMIHHFHEEDLILEKSGDIWPVSPDPKPVSFKGQHHIIDLHDYNGLADQLNTTKMYLGKYFESLTIIHGKGNGIPEKAIIKCLEAEFNHLHFERSQPNEGCMKITYRTKRR
jgi:dsDNA-specific endonuclease/ATPase MutS2